MAWTRYAVLGVLLLMTTHTFAGDRLFIESATLNDDDTATFPIYEGRVGEETVWFILTDASDGDFADEFEINEADKLENARGSGAVQSAWIDDDGVFHFDATVDFSPERVIVPSPGTGFPPLVAEPGSVGELGYSPLAELPDGTIINAPHIANSTGLHDSAEDLDTNDRTVRIELVDGFARRKPVLYISTDASSPVAAALEGSTYAPALNDAPGLGNDGSDSSRSSLAAFTNGQTGVGNRDRQGLNSALLGEGDPINLLAWLPNQGRYSPLWDVFLTTWDNPADAELIERFADVEDLAEDGDVTAPDGTEWGPSNFIVNCPIVQRVD